MDQQLKCDRCGQFVSWRDKGVKHEMVTPDSDLTCEEWETLCAKCNQSEIQKLKEEGK